MLLAQVHNDGQNHGIALDLIVDVAMQLILDAVLNAGPVAALDAAVAGDDIAHGVADALDDILVFAHIDKAAADDVRAGHQHAVGAVKGHGHDNQAVLRQMLAVAQHHIAHIADTQAIHQHGARGHLARDAYARSPGQFRAG